MGIELQALLIGLAIAAVLGYFTARSRPGARKSTVERSAQVFHYIGRAFRGNAARRHCEPSAQGRVRAGVSDGRWILVVSYIALVIFAFVGTQCMPLNSERKRNKADRAGRPLVGTSKAMQMEVVGAIHESPFLRQALSC
jgi:hypothetical protein